MSNKAPDIVASMAEGIASPGVVAEIDKAIQGLVELRKLAVHLHGEPAASASKPPQPSPVIVSSDTQYEIKDGPVVGDYVIKPARPVLETAGGGQRFDGTVGSLIRHFQTDPHSPYQKLRFHSRQNYDSLCKRIEQDCGHMLLADLNARAFISIHKEWVGPNSYLSMAHALIGMFRGLLSFGASILEDPHCQRLSAILSKLRFEMAKRRTERLSAEQAMAIITKAHEIGYHSIALAQAIQFDLALRQKDVIGEWVPLTEDGEAFAIDGEMKWIRGIVWSEIDKELILKHVTSKTGTMVKERLSESPMVMAELERIGLDRLPSEGPLIVFERTQLPFWNYQFRREWRMVATAAGVPMSLRNSDTRLSAKEAAEDEEDD